MDFRLSLLLVALSYGAVAFAANETSVAIYFESLCPDSQKFFTEEFQKAYNKLNKDVKFDLVPYGHFNGTDCQHGAPECEGNKILDCAVKLINGNELVDFVVCIMGNNTAKNDDHFNSSLCKNKTVAFDKIISCSNQSEGDQYFKEFGKRTEDTFKNLTKFDVPFIIVDNVLNQTLSLELRYKFADKLCSGPFKDKHFGGCSSSSTLAASVISTLLAVLMTRL